MNKLNLENNELIIEGKIIAVAYSDINSNGKKTGIMNKLFKDVYTDVKSNFTIFQGIVTGNNTAFIFESKQDAIDNGVDEELLKPMCFGRDISQWAVKNTNNVILYLNKDYDINQYPSTKKWLSNFRADLKKRRECKKGSIPWYSLQWARIKDELDVKNKIFIQRTRNERLKKRIVATIDETGLYTAESLWNIIPKKDDYSIYFLLAILNSNLINYLFSTKFLNLGIKKDYLNKISFPQLSLEEQQPFIDLVKKILDLHEKLIACNTPQEEKIINIQIEKIEDEINSNVYEMYGLNEEEITIVESVNKDNE